MPSFASFAFFSENQVKLLSFLGYRLFECSCTFEDVQQTALQASDHAGPMRGVGRGGGGCRERPGVHWGAHSLKQPSSRQRPQQINLLVTLHLDCINVELGPITAIGRTWQSRSTVILPPQERPLLNPADKGFSALLQNQKSLDFFFFGLFFNSVISIADQVKKCVRVSPSAATFKVKVSQMFLNIFFFFYF